MNFLRRQVKARKLSNTGVVPQATFGVDTSGLSWSLQPKMYAMGKEACGDLGFQADEVLANFILGGSIPSAEATMKVTDQFKVYMADSTIDKRKIFRAWPIAWAEMSKVQLQDIWKKATSAIFAVMACAISAG